MWIRIQNKTTKVALRPVSTSLEVSSLIWFCTAAEKSTIVPEIMDVLLSYGLYNGVTFFLLLLSIPDRYDDGKFTMMRNHESMTMNEQAWERGKMGKIVNVTVRKRES